MNTVQRILIYLPITSHINTVYLTHLMSWYWYVMKSILYSNFLSLLFFKLKFLFSISVEQITFNHPVSLASSASLCVSDFPRFSRAWQFWGVSVCSRAQSCPTLSDPMGCSPPGSSVWDFPGKNTRGGCCFLLQGIFLTQGWKPHLLCLLHWQVDSLPPSHLGSPSFEEYWLGIWYNVPQLVFAWYFSWLLEF